MRKMLYFAEVEADTQSQILGKYKNAAVVLVEDGLHLDAANVYLKKSIDDARRANPN